MPATVPGDARPLVSLCLITGNREAVIRRCLDSFSPHVDEIVVVRAVGAMDPDSTLDIARGYGCVTAEYRNASGRVHPRDGAAATWDHVDDFAAARAMSFDLASGRYLLWADTDDILRGDGAFLRAFAAEGSLPFLQIGYRVIGTGVALEKARLWRAGAWRWHRAVHEQVVPSSKESARGARAGCVWYEHLEMDGRAKPESSSRNLRILESLPEEEYAADAVLRYYLHSELAAAERNAEAIEAGQRALADPALPDVERYEVLLNIARIAALTGGAPEHVERVALEAYRVDPTRREALALLCAYAMDTRAPARALAYSRAMIALPLPERRAWTLRHDLYDREGVALHCQALREAGQEALADSLERSANGPGGPVISLLHAARGRPERGVATRAAWMRFASDPRRVEHIFAFAVDDTETGALLARYQHTTSAAGLHRRVGGNAVANWNAAAAASRGKILVCIADDLEPCPAWDDEILARLDPDAPAVLAAPDGIRNSGELLCHPILTRAYYERFGYVFHPDYRGVYCDNEFTDVARCEGAVIDAPEARVYRHLHPVAGHAGDAVHAAMNAPEAYEFGRDIYSRRAFQGFPALERHASRVIVGAAYDLRFLASGSALEASLALHCNVPHVVYGIDFNHQPVSGRGARLDTARYRIDPRPSPCPQHGEFLAQDLAIADGAVVVFVDADAIMQRRLSADDVAWLESIPDGEVWLGRNAFEGQSLLHEAENFLRPRAPIAELVDSIGGDWSRPIANTGVVICTARTYREIYDGTLAIWPRVAAAFAHPAALQWAMCHAIHSRGIALRDLPLDWHAHGCHGSPRGVAASGEGLVFADRALVRFAHNIGRAARIREAASRASAAAAARRD